ncbi:MAG TPA: hypothetical protein VNY51_11515 [Candidatus Dormibacteraeota bacterium]|jgi:hypothetical protein|nr:hypothetical protein [Candidatus Dormibacteraeota bacterium]
MLKRLSLLAVVVALAAAVLFFKPARVAHAQSNPVATGIGTITSYQTAWSANQAFVTTTATAINPGGCTLPAGSGYMTDPNNASVEQAALLGAFLSGKPVTLYLSGCTQERPLILGVNVSP